VASVTAPVAVVGTRCDMRDESDAGCQKRAGREAEQLRDRRERGPQHDPQRVESDPVFDQGIDALISRSEAAAAGATQRWTRGDMAALAKSVGARAFVECSAKTGEGLGCGGSALTDVLRGAGILAQPPDAGARMKCSIV
jgi:hypothetical protein